MKDRMSAVELLGLLSKTEYNDFRALESALAKVFREHVKQLPNGYGSRELIRWARANKWIERDGERIVLRLPAGV